MIAEKERIGYGKPSDSCAFLHRESSDILWYASIRLLDHVEKESGCALR